VIKAVIRRLSIAKHSPHQKRSIIGARRAGFWDLARVKKGSLVEGRVKMLNYKNYLQ
jgi:hypothetical protein